MKIASRDSKREAEMLSLQIKNLELTSSLRHLEKESSPKKSPSSGPRPARRENPCEAENIDPLLRSPDQNASEKQEPEEEPEPEPHDDAREMSAPETRNVPQKTATRLSQAVPAFNLRDLQGSPSGIDGRTLPPQIEVADSDSRSHYRTQYGPWTGAATCRDSGREKALSARITLSSYQPSKELQESLISRGIFINIPQSFSAGGTCANLRPNCCL